MKFRFLLGAIFSALVGACSLPTLDNSTVERSAKAYDQLVLGQYADLVGNLEPKIDLDQSRPTLDQLRSLIPTTQGSQGHLVGWNMNASTNSGDVTRNMLRYDYGETHLLFTGIYARENGGKPWRMTGFELAVAGADIVSAPDVGPMQPAPPLKPAN